MLMNSIDLHSDLPKLLPREGRSVFFVSRLAGISDYVPDLCTVMHDKCKVLKLI